MRAEPVAKLRPRMRQGPDAGDDGADPGANPSTSRTKPRMKASRPEIASTPRTTRSTQVIDCS